MPLGNDGALAMLRAALAWIVAFGPSLLSPHMAPFVDEGLDFPALRQVMLA